jgi:conjugal transfer pilus assembly protein TraB
MAVDFKKITDYLSKHKKLLIIGVIAIAVFYGLFMAPEKPQKKEEVIGKGNITTEERLRSEIEGLKKTVEELKKQKETPKEEPKKEEPKDIAKEKPKSLEELEKALGAKKELPPPGQEEISSIQPGIQQIQVQQLEPPKPRLIKIEIPETVKEEKKVEPQHDLYLPSSSFASFTLTSGVYAPETGEQMPVSGVIDRVFIGPNKSSIPLKGCLFLGKARGNTGYKTADIKVVKMSCVWPDGETFEADVSGYVTDVDGNFGLKGKVIRHSGAFFSTTGITSFIEGFAAGLARAQEQQDAVASQFDTAVTTNIIGSAAQYGLFKGAQEFASAAKQFFGSQLQGLIPAVEVPGGSKGYVFITSGVRISGGKNALYHIKTDYYDPHNLSSK